jgi:hypothetical protein
MSKEEAQQVITPLNCGIKLKYGQNTANQSQKGWLMRRLFRIRSNRDVFR